MTFTGYGYEHKEDPLKDMERYWFVTGYTLFINRDHLQLTYTFHT